MKLIKHIGQKNIGQNIGKIVQKIIGQKMKSIKRTRSRLPKDHFKRNRDNFLMVSDCLDKEQLERLALTASQLSHGR